jgi:hypothetical protein
MRRGEDHMRLVDSELFSSAHGNFIDGEVYPSESAEYIRQLAELSAQQPPSTLEQWPRRIEPSIDNRAHMSWVKPLLTGRVQIRVEGISRERLRIEVAEWLPPGAIIQVHFRRNVILADVRYCVVFGPLFLAGLQIQNMYRKSLRRPDLKQPAATAGPRNCGLRDTTILPKPLV